MYIFKNTQSNEAENKGYFCSSSRVTLDWQFGYFRRRLARMSVRFAEVHSLTVFAPTFVVTLQEKCYFDLEILGEHSIMIRISGVILC